MILLLVDVPNVANGTLGDTLPLGLFPLGCILLGWPLIDRHSGLILSCLDSQSVSCVRDPSRAPRLCNICDDDSLVRKACSMSNVKMSKTSLGYTLFYSPPGNWTTKTLLFTRSRRPGDTRAYMYAYIYITHAPRYMIINTSYDQAGNQSPKIHFSQTKRNTTNPTQRYRSPPPEAAAAAAAGAAARTKTGVLGRWSWRCSYSASYACGPWLWSCWCMVPEALCYARGRRAVELGSYVHQALRHLADVLGRHGSQGSPRDETGGCWTHVALCWSC